MSGMLSVDRVHRICIRIALLLIMGMWVYFFIQYPKLPAIVPSHFNSEGQIDGEERKNLLWFFPAIMTAVFGLLLALNRDGKNVAEATRKKYFFKTRILLTVIQLNIALFGCIFLVKIIQSALLGYSTLSNGWIMAFEITMILPNMLYLISVKFANSKIG